MVTRLILMRHADIDFSASHRDLDGIPLTRDGLKRADKLAESKKLGKYDLVYTSPAKRAYDTARVFALRIQKQPIVEPCLNERITIPYWTDSNNWARIDTMTWSDFDTALEGGESLNEARNRMFHCVQGIVDKNPGKTLLIVSHATVLCLLISSLTGKIASREERERIGFGSYALAHFEGGKFSLDSGFG